MTMTLATRGSSERIVEWMFSAMMISWGLYLWLPMQTFEQPQYSLLKAIADEKVWGAFSISIGSVRMVALIINGQIRQTPIIRAAAAGFGVMWWLVLTFLFMTAAASPPAGVVWYPIFVLFEAYSVLRSSADAFMSDAFRRSTSTIVR